MQSAEGPMSADAGRLKVGYVLDRFPCASETFIANEVRGVAECGIEVTVFAVRAGKAGVTVPAEVVYPRSVSEAGPYGSLRSAPGLLTEALRVEGPSPRHLPAALRRSGIVRRFAAEADRRGIRRLHAHFATLPAALAFMIGRLTGARVSFSAHAWDVYVEPGRLPRKLARADFCVTCTEANARFLRRLAPDEGGARIVTIYHGTDLERFTFRPRERTASPPLVAAMGRFVPKKGFHTLLRACKLLAEGMEVRCEVAGEGAMAARLARLAARLGLEGNCAFPGWLPYEETPQFYDRADVVAVPSVRGPDGNRDGLPNVVVEAMACGVPVVASALSGIPEAVEHERTGLLVPPGDPAALATAIERVLTDAALRARLVAAARRRVEERFDCREGSRAIAALLSGGARRSAAEAPGPPPPAPRP
jgi:glycosyltransferase involved in cell wall biosynthesis